VSSTLQAGAGSLPLVAPVGVDLVGYLRRFAPAAGYGQPLEAGALVLDDGDTRLVIVGFDGLGTPGEYGRALRAAAAEAAGCAPEAVLVNASHTHAAPPPPGMLKLGGTTTELRGEEARYAESLVDVVASAVALAAGRLAPARAGAARGGVELGVNRRQRTEGETILGWNPDGVCDREVAVLRVDAADGAPLATVVAYACHPVVVGPEVPELSSDFVGPLRARVRAWTGGDCLFLQACAGNILPLEAFVDHAGPEHAFGERLALAALAARDRASTIPREPRQAPFASAVPIALWRLEPTGELPDSRLAAAEEVVALPLLEPPELDGIRSIRTGLAERVERLRRDGEGREVWNPPAIHLEWARRVEQRVAGGTVERERESIIQALRIGEVGILAWPSEPFCELGLEVKERTAAPFPIVLGYSNDLVGYTPTRDEYRYGGYEPSVSQRHFGNPSPFGPEAGELLVERGLALLDRLFAEARTTA